MGEYTTNDYFYKPALGASGSAEKALYDAALDSTDAVIASLVASVHDGDTLECDGIDSDGGTFQLTSATDIQFGIGADLDALKLTSSKDLYLTDGDLYVRNGTAGQSAVIFVGVDDSVNGQLYLFGDNASDGAKIRLYQPANDDASIDNYQFIAEDGNLTIGPNTDIDALKLDSNKNFHITAGDLIVSNAGTTGFFYDQANAELTIGVSDSTRGTLYLMGNGASSAVGGVMRMYLAADYDATIDYYQIRGWEDDLLIGPNTDTDALKLDSNKDLYITDGKLFIQRGDTTRFQFDQSAGVANLFVGTDDAQYGGIVCYGDHASSDLGGRVTLYLATDHDTTISYYMCQAYQDDLLIGPNTNTDMFQLLADGYVAFGTHAAIGAETVTGYITIKDEAGNSRKLAVVS